MRCRKPEQEAAAPSGRCAESCLGIAMFGGKPVESGKKGGLLRLSGDCGSGLPLRDVRRVKLGHLIGCPSGLLLRIRRLLFDGSVSLR